MQILIVQTGASADPADPKPKKWYELDENSLQSTLMLTFSFVYLLVFVQSVVQLVHQARVYHSKGDFNQGYMAMTDLPDPNTFCLEHVSYQIEAQQRLLMRHALMQNLSGRKEEIEGELDVNNGLFRFAINKRYFDSLQSNVILADQQPIFVEQEASGNF